MAKVHITVDGVTRTLTLTGNPRMPVAMSVSEARYLARNTAISAPDLAREFDQRTPDAVAFCWWLACQQAGEPLPVERFLDIDFDLGAMQVEVESDEPDGSEEAAGPTSPPPSEATSTPTSEPQDQPSSTSTE